jgi:hypothetical protein
LSSITVPVTHLSRQRTGSAALQSIPSGQVRGARQWQPSSAAALTGLHRSPSCLATVEFVSKNEATKGLCTDPQEGVELEAARHTGHSGAVQYVTHIQNKLSNGQAEQRWQEMQRDAPEEPVSAPNCQGSLHRLT